MVEQTKKTIFFCSGMASGGTTLVSWCFLQRSEMDGALDVAGNRPIAVPRVSTPYIWYKMCIRSFRWMEMAAIFEQWGYQDIRPLLVVRDVRAALASLEDKPYGRKSFAPRIRCLRFLEDWRLFKDKGWPMLRYETLIEQPRDTLRAACESMGLEWSEAMMTFPKRKENLAYCEHGNDSFFASLSSMGLEATVLGYRKMAAQRPFQGLAHADVVWLDKVFSSYNAYHDYPYDGSRYIQKDAVPWSEDMELYDDPEGRLSAVANLYRLKNHPVFGRLIPAWQRFINHSFDVLPKE